jgi:hypothetical protein
MTTDAPISASAPAVGQQFNRLPDVVLHQILCYVLLVPIEDLSNGEFIDAARFTKILHGPVLGSLRLSCKRLRELSMTAFYKVNVFHFGRSRIDDVDLHTGSGSSTGTGTGYAPNYASNYGSGPGSGSGTGFVFAPRYGSGSGPGFASRYGSGSNAEKVNVNAAGQSQLVVLLPPVQDRVYFRHIRIDIYIEDFFQVDNGDGYGSVYRPITTLDEFFTHCAGARHLRSLTNTPGFSALDTLRVNVYTNFRFDPIMAMAMIHASGFHVLGADVDVRSYSDAWHCYLSLVRQCIRVN